MTTTFTTSGVPRTTTCAVARPSSGRVFWNPTLEQADVLDHDGDANTTELARSWYMKNAVGSVMQVQEPDRTEGVTYRYDPYGEVTITRGGTSQSGDPLGQYVTYTGRWRDEEAALYHYRARTYDPLRGRFLQRDPLGYRPDPNVYQYVGSRPAVLRDPFGLDSVDRRSTEFPVNWIGPFEVGWARLDLTFTCKDVIAEVFMTGLTDLVIGVGYKISCSPRELEKTAHERFEGTTRKVWWDYKYEVVCQKTTAVGLQVGPQGAAGGVGHDPYVVGSSSGASDELDCGTREGAAPAGPPPPPPPPAPPGVPPGLRPTTPPPFDLDDLGRPPHDVMPLPPQGPALPSSGDLPPPPAGSVPAPIGVPQGTGG